MWEGPARDLGLVYHPVPISDGWNPRDDGRSLVDLARISGGRRPNIIHVHGAKAALLSRLAVALGPPPRVVYTLHGFLVRPAMPSWQRVAYPAGERLLAPLTSAYIAVSQSVMDDFIEQAGVRPERIRVVRNGISQLVVPQTAVEDLRRHLGLGNALVTGVVGRLAREKGIDLFLRAASLLRGRHPDWRFLVAGGGPLRCELEGIAVTLGLSDTVIFTGEVRDPETFIAALDVLVVPSVSEGLSMVALEAMSLGKPVAAARVGGIPEVVDHGCTGLLFCPGDPEEMARALDALGSDAGLRRRMGEAGRLKAREFDLTLAAKATMEVYQQVLEGAHPGRGPR
jgi:glycosyltransferase involved in cell wall biosynthesis